MFEVAFWCSMYSMLVLAFGFYVGYEIGKNNGNSNN
jgi:hypothetical protein